MKNLSDEKLDQILTRIVKGNVLSEDEVDEIANSPRLLWRVRRSIAEQKAVSEKSWFAAFNRRIPAFASLLFLIGIGVFWSLSFRETQSVVENEAVEMIAPANAAQEKFETPEPKIEIAENEVTKEIGKPEKAVEKRISKKSSNQRAVSRKFITSEPKTLEVATKVVEREKIKTDFIALSYSPAAESGQILNVKVPRSMMVALGVTSNVENISELVNAEVVMGDDGLARAIRFVQEN